MTSKYPWNDYTLFGMSEWPVGCGRTIISYKVNLKYFRSFYEDKDIWYICVLIYIPVSLKIRVEKCPCPVLSYICIQLWIHVNLHIWVGKYPCLVLVYHAFMEQDVLAVQHVGLLLMSVGVLTASEGIISKRKNKDIIRKFILVWI